MTNATKVQPKIEPTAAEKSAVLEALWRRNRTRADARLPRLDVPTEYYVTLQRLRVEKFEQLLSPFLERAMVETSGHPGIAGRMKQRREALRKAETWLLASTGVRRPLGTWPVMLREFDGVRWLWRDTTR